MIFATIVFVLSLLLTAALFFNKHREMRSGRVLAPELRAKADIQAVHIKELAHAARKDVDKLIPELMRLGRFAVHEAALAIAATARFSEKQAHLLADMVSHKRGFERHETQSEFLKKVAEHKNGNGLDATE